MLGRSGLCANRKSEKGEKYMGVLLFSAVDMGVLLFSAVDMGVLLFSAVEMTQLTLVVPFLFFGKVSP